MGELEKFKKPNRRGGGGGWKIIQNVINGGLGVPNQQPCSKLSASNTIETKETIIIKYCMQILQILMQNISKNSSSTFKNSQELVTAMHWFLKVNLQHLFKLEMQWFAPTIL